ncbi:hypothetical protein TREMEDRAFT_58615 [Tremella mesenterica DSM 1558]|uniref:uncharacterized protein n=1 Tax=Tremella mesenterica (strain ATCC 24925 / CBS 8224 / DSM 1558 / NBRC 9311 / NRRL Y-6157 / RJB 2259-6 / UBC 559-6) TaxID=578456 RepID=UPI0003F4950F|nr:uncharacterized protein TREMEDRAFT_58615 [Tremella mesenterica DSM 1558]EIW72450.1 hypothetical protein TREMEDRAFT_58615 [Tremella mesenterica DSM 1558]
MSTQENVTGASSKTFDPVLFDTFEAYFTILGLPQYKVEGQQWSQEDSQWFELDHFLEDDCKVDDDDQWAKAFYVACCTSPTGEATLYQLNDGQWMTPIVPYLFAGYHTDVNGESVATFIRFDKEITNLKMRPRLDMSQIMRISEGDFGTVRKLRLLNRSDVNLSDSPPEPCIFLTRTAFDACTGGRSGCEPSWADQKRIRELHQPGVVSVNVNREDVRVPVTYHALITSLGLAFLLR